MRLLKNIPKLDFMKLRVPFLVLSAVTTIICIAAIFIRGMNFGIDFTGGTLIEVNYPESVELNTVRDVLHSNGYNDAIVQHFGSSRDILVRVAPREGKSGAQISTEVLDSLHKTSTGEIKLRRVEFVGPQVGNELFEKGGLALLTAIGGILIYVWLRFEKRLALGACIALLHDAIFVVGFFALFQIEFDLTVLAAVLAVIGYSVNDSIVVFDRVRDNFRKVRKGTSMEVVNMSVNQTLSRTMMTSLTTLLTVVALFFFGGDNIHGFALAMIVGITVGTYSSVYVASALALVLGVSKQDLMPPEKEGADSTPIM